VLILVKSLHHHAEQEGKTVRYIENNPTKAKLVLVPKEWGRSSARFRDEHGRICL